MNKRIIILGIIGIIIITTVVVLVSNISGSENVEVLTDTPADNYPEIVFNHKIVPSQATVNRGRLYAVRS